MKTVTVIDRRTGRQRAMQPRYADILSRLGRVEYTQAMKAEAVDEPQEASEGASGDDDKPAKKKARKKAKKRAYKRRDMQAED